MAPNHSTLSTKFCGSGTGTCGAGVMVEGVVVEQELGGSSHDGLCRNRERRELHLFHFY